MAKQIYYEDVEVGYNLPTLVKHPTTQQLVRWAGAANDYNPIHYDKDFAQSQGLPGVIVHGLLNTCFLSQMIIDWMGEEGTLSKLTSSYKGMAFPGEDIICKGKVTKKYVDEDGDYCVEIERHAINQRGEDVMPGHATVALPSRDNRVSPLDTRLR